MKELQAGNQGSVTVRKTAGSLHLGSGYTSNGGALLLICLVKHTSRQRDALVKGIWTCTGTK